jgi:hypothetical protein
MPTSSERRAAGVSASSRSFTALSMLVSGFGSKPISVSELLFSDSQATASPAEYRCGKEGNFLMRPPINPTVAKSAVKTLAQAASNIPRAAATTRHKTAAATAANNPARMPNLVLTIRMGR